MKSIPFTLTPLILVSLVPLLIACGTAGSNAPEQDLGGMDDLFGSLDFGAPPDQRGTHDTLKETAGADYRTDGIHDLLDVTSEIPPSPDLHDQAEPPDLVDLATPDGGSDETSQPDLAQPDITQPDVEVTYCNGQACPADKPLCVLGKCACDPAGSCKTGSFCFTSGECLPCDLDSKCGPNCQDCGDLGPSYICANDNSGCVQCDEAAGFGCPLSQKCVLGKCVACSSLGLCGTQCLQCSGSTPECAQNKCVCNASSCPYGSICEYSYCVTCTDNDPLHCGPSCAKCTGGSPHCKQGSCTLCNSNNSCGPACSACPANKPFCRPDGQGCVECLYQTDCAPGLYCTPAATCGECLNDAQCPPEEYCGGYQCIPDKPADACPGNLTPDGTTCAKAKIISRTSVSNLLKTFSGSTSSTGNEDDASCSDSADDAFYRIYLIPGDVVELTLDPEMEFNAVLKVYQGIDCDNNGTGDLVICVNDSGFDSDEEYTFTVVTAGWYTLVVDGTLGGADYDYGSYDLDVKVTCLMPSCNCP